MIARNVAVAVLGMGCLLIGSAPSRSAEGPNDDQIASAISRGVAFLKETQRPGGNWSFSFNLDHDLGITALAGLALLENGVDPSDKAIGKATEVVRTLAARSDQTYDLALAILFLSRVQPGSRGPHDDLIQRLGRRLAGGGPAGVWNYNVPPDSDESTKGSSDKRAPATAKKKPNSRARPQPRLRLSDGDNSNTQFALLGIWAAGRHGFESNDALEAIDGHFRGSQNYPGRWGYKPGMAGTNAMTCAGLMGLAIAAARPKQAERLSARARGAALAADPVFASALRCVAEDAREISEESEIYYLWSLERVCVALGLRQIQGFDWYSTGARILLGSQRPDGSWPDQRWGSLPNTCLALLFLRKANLAFELDRVLKLPGARRPEAVAESEAKAAPAPVAKGAGDDVSVLVTGASDAKFPEIAVEFEVKRPDGSFLLDGKQADIHVTEDDRPMTILRFQAPTATERMPTTVVLVVDRSLSMEEEDRIGSLKQAVVTFMKGLPKGSRVAVVAFGSEVEKICPFTSDAQQVQDAVNALQPGGATRYYDAVAEALGMLEKESGRRAVLALTDGEDTFSQTSTLDSVIAAARRLGLPVHTLGLGSEDEIESTALRRLASATRGQYYSARQSEQLRAIYEQLAERLRSTYTLMYRTDRKLPDGTLRPVRVSYRASKIVGVTKVFVPGMVVPAAGWSPLFLALVATLTVLAMVPGQLARWSGRKT